MVTTLAQLHLIDWRSLGLADFGGKGEYTARQISVWSNNYLKAIPAGEKENKNMEKLMEWLPKSQSHGEQPKSKKRMLYVRQCTHGYVILSPPLSLSIPPSLALFPFPLPLPSSPSLFNSPSLLPF